MEARNKKGEEYIGSTLYVLCAAIQRFVREDRVGSNGASVDIFKDSNFMHFLSVLDSKLKDLHSKGIGTTKKQTEVISNELEELLWEKNILGDDMPEKLLYTLAGVVLWSAICFMEHRKIRPDMFEVIESRGSRPYLLYTKSGSKNHTGGFNATR